MRATLVKVLFFQATAQNTWVIFCFHQVNKYSQLSAAAVDLRHLKVEVAE